jgi:metal-dependent amidase/aminoacylase/carboxypeptidase family protein
MTIVKDLQQLHPEMRQWRRHLHQFPETAFEETQTAAFIAEKLSSFGLAVHQGLGKTGVVATLSVGNSEKKNAFSAYMYALIIQ